MKKAIIIFAIITGCNANENFPQDDSLNGNDSTEPDGGILSDSGITDTLTTTPLDTKPALADTFASTDTFDLEHAPPGICSSVVTNCLKYEFDSLVKKPTNLSTCVRLYERGIYYEIKPFGPMTSFSYRTFPHREMRLNGKILTPYYDLVYGPMLKLNETIQPTMDGYHYIELGPTPPNTREDYSTAIDWETK